MYSGLISIQIDSNAFALQGLDSMAVPGNKGTRHNDIESPYRCRMNISNKAEHIGIRTGHSSGVRA